jgi:hypothetical protein
VIGGGGSAASYAASKGGILQLTKQIAVDYGAQGVRAVCVCPGQIKTNLGKNAREDRLADTTPEPDPLPRPRHWTPLQRAATSDEVAAVVSFLLSDEASFVTGRRLRRRRAHGDLIVRLRRPASSSTGPGALQGGPGRMEGRMALIANDVGSAPLDLGGRESPAPPGLQRAESGR